MIIDVGGVYDPATHRYDHHQREFTEKMGHGFSCTKLSSAGELAGLLATAQPCSSSSMQHGLCETALEKSCCAGLVYRHFGREVIAKLLGISVDHADMESIYWQVYKVRLSAVWCICFCCPCIGAIVAVSLSCLCCKAGRRVAATAPCLAQLPIPTSICLSPCCTIVCIGQALCPVLYRPSLRQWMLWTMVRPYLSILAP